MSGTDSSSRPKAEHGRPPMLIENVRALGCLILIGGLGVALDLFVSVLVHRPLSLWYLIDLLALVLLVIAAIFWCRSIGLKKSPGCCPQCNYDLRGNTSGVCPECGGRV